VPLIDIDNLQPYGDRLIVTRYQKPETVKGIIIPEAYRGDRSQTLWELVKWNEPQARDSLFKEGVVIIGWEEVKADLSTADGIPLRVGMIVQTLAWSQTDLGDGKHFSVEPKNVRALHVWEAEDD
jgi:hypothetical protein